MTTELSNYLHANGAWTGADTQLQAKADGYDGALMLTPGGKVSEAPIACFFMVRDGRLITPSVTSNILESITRDTILTLYREMTGREAEQRQPDEDARHAPA